MNHEEYRERLSALLDGELSEAERADALAHLEGCAACRTYFAELSALREALREPEDVSLPEGFAASVLARVHEEKAPKPAKKAGAWRRWSALAACAALVALAAVVPHMRMGRAAGADSAAATESAYAIMSAAPAAPVAPGAPAGGGAETPDTNEAESFEAELYAVPAPEAPRSAESGKKAADTAGDVVVCVTEGPEEDAARSCDSGTAAVENAELPAVLTLCGEGAADWLAAHCTDDYAGDNLYVVSGEALRALPDGLTLRDDEALARWESSNGGDAIVRAAETEAES